MNPREGESERTGERADEQSLRRPGNALDQQMTAGEERDERILDCGILSNDAGADRLSHPCQQRGTLLQSGSGRERVLI